MEIEKIWLYPPLALARVGGSSEPLEAFFWGPNDVSTNGSGQTTILPAETLRIDSRGRLSAYTPARIVFKDDDGFRPVCPFFELHGRWGDGDRWVEGPLTKEVLDAHGCSASDLEWTVSVANLKAYHMCQDPGAKVSATLTLKGSDTKPLMLEGRSPDDVPEPLVPYPHKIILGSVQLTRPTTEFPEFRLRFTPGKGKFYGPKTLARRWDVRLPIEALILNPHSPWCRWKPTPPDYRGEPGGQYAQDENEVSYGMLDDVCDGIVECRIPRLRLRASARVVSGPPDYAPDRRHLTSIADGLKDRTSRLEVTQDKYFDDMTLCDQEIGDLMERILETVSLSNIDVLNSTAYQHNAALVKSQPLSGETEETNPFPIEPSLKDLPLPLTERGRTQHRRLANISVLKDLLRKDPGLFERAVRRPFDPSRYTNRKMPLGMRGAAGTPLSLTPRQHEFFEKWIGKLHEDHKHSNGSEG
jgi:hypothetical protein